MSTESARRARIDAPYLRTLRAAVTATGGEAALAAAWGVPPEKLASWLAGEGVLPVDVRGGPGNPAVTRRRMENGSVALTAVYLKLEAE